MASYYIVRTLDDGQCSWAVWRRRETFAGRYWDRLANCDTADDAQICAAQFKAEDTDA